MNALPINGKMTYKDAAIVATILMMSAIAVLFMPFHGYDVYISDPQRYGFDIIVFAFAAWITNFVVLTGLNVYAQKAQAQSG
jgi:hypothetical protein